MIGRKKFNGPGLESCPSHDGGIFASGSSGNFNAYCAGLIIVGHTCISYFFLIFNIGRRLIRAVID